MKALVCLNIHASTLRPLTSCRRSWRRASGKRHEDHHGVHNSGVPCGIRILARSRCANDQGRINICTWGLGRIAQVSWIQPARRCQSTLSLKLLTSYRVIVCDKELRHLCVYSFYEPFPCSLAEGLYLSCQDYHPDPFITKHLFSILWGQWCMKIGVTLQPDEPILLVWHPREISHGEKFLQAL